MSYTNPSQYMNLPIPVVAQDPGPDWANNIVASLTQIDSHTHTGSPYGQQLTPASLNINSSLTFLGNSATHLLTASFNNQSSALSASSYPGALYMAGNNLYFNDGTGSDQVQITSGGSVNATSSGIASGTASASFSSGVLVVDSNTNTPGNIKAGSYLMGDGTTDGYFVTLQPPTLSGGYTITLPSLPGSGTNFVTLNSSGMSGGVSTSGGITGSNIASGTVTNSNLAATNATIVSVSTTGASSGTGVQVASATITTTGTRYVMLRLSSTVSGSPAYVELFNTSALSLGQVQGIVQFVKNGTTSLAEYPIQTVLLGPSGGGESVFEVPASAFSHIDFAPSSGSNTYSINISMSSPTNGNVTIACVNCFFQVIEM